MAKFAFALLWMLFGGSAAAFVEENVHRHGATYDVRALDEADAASCEALCGADDACRAWSYVRPGRRAEHALCELKSAVTPAEFNPCCVSGVSPPVSDNTSPSIAPSESHASVGVSSPRGELALTPVEAAPEANMATANSDPRLHRPARRTATEGPVIIGPEGPRRAVPPRSSNGVPIYSITREFEAAPMITPLAPVATEAEEAERAGLVGG